MTTVVGDSASASSTDISFVRYLAEQPRIAPSLVFRRLKVMGGFLACGVAGAVAALALTVLDGPQSEPARLLTAFGFVASAAVVIATATSALLLLWGAYIGQYVENLERRGEVMDAYGMEGMAVSYYVPPPDDAEVSAAMAEVVVQANNEVVQIVTGDVDAVVEALAKTADESQRQEARDIRKELADLQVRIAQLHHRIPRPLQLKLYASLQQSYLLSYVQLRKKAEKEAPSPVGQQGGVTVSGE